MIVGYARCSTSDQKLDLQLDALRAAECAQVVEEHASGAKARPKLDRLIASLKAGDVLVVWKLDRLGRSLIDLLQLVQRIEAQGANLRSLDGRVDTSTPSGRLVFSVFGALAEYERALIMERSQAGREAARKRGVHLGRPASLSDAQVKHAAGLVRRGRSLREAAELVGASKSALHRALRAAGA